AQEIIETINSPNLKLMFDCYHVGRTEGDVTRRLQDLQAIIGHIQFASVPDRGEPDQGELNYEQVFAQIESMGWTEPLGAEYRPAGPTGESLNWMAHLRDR
ncbi:MAG: TIM barrel protein, partial [Acidimicrobiia bacterium]